MLRSIALWLLDLIYGSLDKDVAAQVDAVKAKLAAAEQARRNAQADLNALLVMRNTLGQEAVVVKLSNETTLAVLEAARVERQKLSETLSELDRDRDELHLTIEARKAEIAQMSDHDAVRQTL